MNGCQLSYTFSSNKDFDKKKFGQYETVFPYLWPDEVYWQLDGCINILPIEFLLQNNWKDYSWFDSPYDSIIKYKGNEVSHREFSKSVKPFDIFSKSTIAVLYLENGACDVVLSTDHNAAYNDFLPMDFDSYINNIIASKGLVDDREKFFTEP